MNTMIFLGGAGVGALIATILFLVLIRAMLGKRSGADKETQEANKRTVQALEVRNEIGKDQLIELRKIANSFKGRKP